MWTVIFTNTSSYQDLLNSRQSKLNAAIAAGEAEPCVFPSALLASGLLTLYLLIPHGNSRLLRLAKYPTFALIVFESVSVMRRCRSLGMANGYLLGISSTWCIYFSAAILLFNDAQRDFKRVVRQRVLSRIYEDASESQSNPNEEESTIRSRHKSERKTGRPSAFNHDKRTPTTSEEKAADTNRDGHGQSYSALVWQPYPRDFFERYDWVSDLTGNFRGTGWNWQISAITPLPMSSEVQCKPQPTPDILGSEEYAARALVRSSACAFISSYLLIDLVKVFMMHDPYFYGLVTTSPSSALPSALTSLYRLSLSLLCLRAVFTLIFALPPLIYVGLLRQIPRISTRLGTRTSPFLYPPIWGSFTAGPLDRGLAGVWGIWWHQLFRFPFVAPSRQAMARLGWGKKEPRARALQLVVAFAMSAAMHACASYTAFADTETIRGPLLFFLLQATGVLLQTGLAAAATRLGFAPSPRWASRTANLAFVAAWLGVTGPLLVDDLARCEVWFTEPLPVSLLRGLGFGLDGMGWWCWRGGLVRWHSGRRWWESGLAL